MLHCVGFYGSCATIARSYRRSARASISIPTPPDRLPQLLQSVLIRPQAQNGRRKLVEGVDVDRPTPQSASSINWPNSLSLGQTASTGRAIAMMLNVLLERDDMLDLRLRVGNPRPWGVVGGASDDRHPVMSGGQIGRHLGDQHRTADLLGCEVLIHDKNPHNRSIRVGFQAAHHEEVSESTSL